MAIDVSTVVAADLAASAEGSMSSCSAVEFFSSAAGESLLGEGARPKAAEGCGLSARGGGCIVIDGGS